MNIQQKLTNLFAQKTGNIAFPSGLTDIGSASKYIYFKPQQIVKPGGAFKKGASSVISSAITSLQGATTIGDIQSAGSNAFQSTVNGNAANSLLSGAASAGAQVQANSSAAANFKPTSTCSSISLPIPSNLVDSSQFNYNVSSLGQEYGLIEGSLSAYNGGQSQSALDYLKSNGTDFVLNNLIGAGGALIGADSQGLQSTLLGTPNQFQKVNFANTTFKQHGFTFRLIARNSTDSGIIHKICSIFKYLSAPRGRNSSIFDVQYAWLIAFDPTVASMLYNFSPCYLTNVEIVFNSGGYSAFHPDGAPVDVTLRLQFIEIAITSQETYNEQFGGSSSSTQYVDSNIDQGTLNTLTTPNT